MSDDKIIRLTEIVPAADGFGERVTNAVEEEAESDLRKEAKSSSFIDIPRPPSGSFLSPEDIRRFAMSRDAPLVKKMPPPAKKPWTVNIGTSEPLLPGVSSVYQEQMQIYFKAKQMVCSANGGKLYITGIFVGQRVQLMQWSSNGMLMDFLRDRTDVDFDTAQPGFCISIQVINRGDTPGTFDLTLFGEASF